MLAGTHSLCPGKLAADVRFAHRRQQEGSTAFLASQISGEAWGGGWVGPHGSCVRQCACKEHACGMLVCEDPTAQGCRNYIVQRWPRRRVQWPAFGKLVASLLTA